MSDLNVLAIAVATVLAFVVGAGWYAAFGGMLARLSDVYAASEQPSPWTMVAELARCLIVVFVVAGLVEWTDLDRLAEAVALSLMLWAGFPVVLLAGSVIHEKVPSTLAAIHSGDWLLKLTIVAVVVGMWP